MFRMQGLKLEHVYIIFLIVAFPQRHFSVEIERGNRGVDGIVARTFGFLISDVFMVLDQSRSVEKVLISSNRRTTKDVAVRVESSLLPL